MTALVQAEHNLSPDDIDAIEERLNSDNRRATRRNDDRGLGFLIRDGSGRMIGLASSLLDIPGRALPNSN